MTVPDLAPYAAVAQRWALRCSSTETSARYQSLLHGNVGFRTVIDGRLARSPRGCGIRRRGPRLLDRVARELVLNGSRVSLSKLEVGVMEYFQRHAGEAVFRMALLENVWEQSYDGGSNVVDVVIRALRKKLANKASVIETVQGVGYRLRRE